MFSLLVAAFMSISEYLYLAMNSPDVETTPRYSQHFFTGFDSVVWLVILLQISGGLLSALTIKYADNGKSTMSYLTPSQDLPTAVAWLPHRQLYICIALCSRHSLPPIAPGPRHSLKSLLGLRLDSAQFRGERLALRLSAVSGSRNRCSHRHRSHVAIL